MILYDFYAEWCGPCKMMHQVIDEFQKKHPDVEVVKVDASIAEELVDKFKVRNLPTLVLMKDDEIVFKHTGALSLTDLEDKIYA